MSNVIIEPVLRIPDVPDNHKALIRASDITSVSVSNQAACRAYALYAVIVHSGTCDAAPPLYVHCRCVCARVAVCLTCGPVARTLAGLTANSGHYYSYCRWSGGESLHLADSASAPWFKFNDSRVVKVSWDQVTSELYESLSDTCYLLVYR